MVDETRYRLQKALDIRGISPKELSDKTGISKSSISQYMSGYAKPKQDRIYLISKALNINPVWLLGYDVSMEIKEPTTEEKKPHPLPRSREGVRIPVYGSIPCGVPIEAIDDIMVKSGLLADDNFTIIESHDGSRVLYDKENPRTEVYISMVKREQ